MHQEKQTPQLESPKELFGFFWGPFALPQTLLTFKMWGTAESIIQPNVARATSEVN